MRRTNSGRLSPHIGEFHKRLHQQGWARYLEMKAMRERGCTNAEIAKAYGCAPSNIYRIFKRYEGR